MPNPVPSRIPKIEPIHVSHPVKPRNMMRAKKKTDNMITLIEKAIRVSTFLESAPLETGLKAT